MKLWDRLALRVGALLSICGGGVEIAAGILLLRENAEKTGLREILPFVLLGAGAVVLLIGVYNLFLPGRYAPRRHAFVIQPTEMGELRIAVPAIENLILKCVEMHKEVKVQDMTISNRRGAINIDLRVVMNSNVSIPHAVEQLQTQVKRYLAASSGIEVRDISVSVVRAAGNAEVPLREETPETPAADAAQPAATEEKIPLHQRIFGRDPKKSVTEQMVEAEMVAPPRATETEGRLPETEDAAEAESAPVADAVEPAEAPAPDAEAADDAPETEEKHDDEAVQSD